MVLGIFNENRTGDDRAAPKVEAEARANQPSSSLVRWEEGKQLAIVKGILQPLVHSNSISLCVFLEIYAFIIKVYLMTIFSNTIFHKVKHTFS